MGMDELAEEDKLAVTVRVRCSVSCHKASLLQSQFTGMPGQYVPLKETIRGFRMIIDGECDDIRRAASSLQGLLTKYLKRLERQELYEHIPFAHSDDGRKSV